MEKQHPTQHFRSLQLRGSCLLSVVFMPLQREQLQGIRTSASLVLSHLHMAQDWFSTE